MKETRIYLRQAPFPPVAFHECLVRDERRAYRKRERQWLKKEMDMESKE